MNIEITEDQKKVIDSNEDLLKPLAKGKGFKEIAHEQGQKPRTVIKRAERIRIKLGCMNLRQVVHICTYYWIGKNATSV